MGLRYGTPLLRWRQSSSMVSGHFDNLESMVHQRSSQILEKLGGFPFAALKFGVERVDSGSRMW